MPATCRTCGKTFPRPNVTLSDFLPAKSERKKGNRSRNSSPAMSRRSRNVSPAMSRRLSVDSWSDSPRDQAVPKSWKTALKPIRPKSTRRSRRTTNWGKLSRTLIYGDSFMMIGASQAANAANEKAQKTRGQLGNTTQSAKLHHRRCAEVKLFTELEGCRSRHATSDAGSGNKN